jgi:hypothetical protein
MLVIVIGKEWGFMFLKKLGLTLFSGVLAIGLLAGCNGDDEPGDVDDHQEDQENGEDTME